MTNKKRSLKHEPLLNNVARTLGHAAGTLTKVTQELTENLSALPETVSQKVREAATLAKDAERTHVRTRRSGKKKASYAARVKKARLAASAKKRNRRSPKRDTSRKGPRGRVRA
jgi:ABC-type transporter Mla subunit MlaD